KAGYEAALTTVPRVNGRSADLVAIKRLGVYDAPPAIFAFKLSRWFASDARPSADLLLHSAVFLGRHGAPRARANRRLARASRGRAVFRFAQPNLTQG